MNTRQYLGCLLIAVFLSASGCTPHTDPLSSWKMLRRFDENLTVPKDLSVPDAIMQDARAYFHTMPPFEKMVAEGIGPVDYYEDGTGQHAVVLSAPKDGERWHYALIYDKDNRRIKVLKYSVGGYMS